MRKYLNAFMMCQSMFCAIPCPWKKWDEDARPHMIMFLPVIGIEIGLLWAVLAWAASELSLPLMLAGALICLCPFFATGFLHLDGFMDVTDAVKSWRDLERRREILKDSRVGAFAVINVACLMIVQFACGVTVMENISRAGMLILVLLPVVSRCCSGLAVTVLPAMESSQYADARKKSFGQILIYVILMLLVVGVAFVFAGKYGFAVLGCVVGYGVALCRAYRSLEGMNGDISGYALTIGELCGLIVLALM